MYYNTPKYKAIPVINVGEEISVVIKNSHKKADSRIKGKVIYKTDRIVAVKKDRYVECICLVDFKIGKAYMSNLF